jgi:hypothetical protein
MQTVRIEQLYNRSLYDPKTKELFYLTANGEILTEVKQPKMDLEDLKKYLNQLKATGIKLKGNPVTPEEKELRRIYNAIKYRQKKQAAELTQLVCSN